MSGARAVAVYVTLGALLIAAPIQASVLTFEPTPGNNLASSNTPLGNTTYGDNIASTGPVGKFLYGMGNGFTPNVTVDYSASHSSDATQTGWFYRSNGGTTSHAAILLTDGDDDAVAANRRFFITFTPDAPWVGIRINSFSLHDFAGFPTTLPSGHTVVWTVYRDSAAPANILATGIATITDGVATPVNIPSLPFSRSVMILELQHLSGARNDLVIDNINFDQMVPEPAGLFTLALGAAMMVRRRSRRLP